MSVRVACSMRMQDRRRHAPFRKTAACQHNVVSVSLSVGRVATVVISPTNPKREGVDDSICVSMCTRGLRSQSL